MATEGDKIMTTVKATLLMKNKSGLDKRGQNPLQERHRLESSWTLRGNGGLVEAQLGCGRYDLGLSPTSS